MATKAERREGTNDHGKCDEECRMHGAGMVGATRDAVSVLKVVETLFHNMWTAADDARAAGSKAAKVSMTIEEAEAVAFTLYGVRERLEEAAGVM